MEWNWKEFKKKRHQFRSYYCAGCRQRKPCQLLTDWDSEWKSYCCWCYYERKQTRAKDYSDYQQFYQQKVKERQDQIKQYQLLRNYPGCPKCGSKEVDAYSLYENNRLVCQPCRMKKEGGASGAISFLEKQNWYKKRQGIDLTEWLTKFQCLPVNYKCAGEWLKDKEHLKKCDCLEQEAKEHYLLVNDNLKRWQEKLKKCACEKSEKIRVDSDHFASCEGCQGYISVASKKRVIRNRNDPRFWGLSVVEKVLCGSCLEEKKTGMKPLRRAKFNEYRRLGRL
ncbi:protein of unknown function [endosymbiont DhMRE of Dentiscutata heterogama]|uniref:hypothetical protein n=1 Tax=endosymbiont DhMRE of Dentiscutata heterogama TaxID=1609546 RepID=UPI000631F488|nr:hypothetical protein [endosymbiont DhMRE of Dentiscutata heterogama]CFW92710.1 protein of unknown function [endosymbiont DhMRE of Dentiscutata heterogama]